MTRPSKTRNDAFALIVEARLQVDNPTKEFLDALKDEIREWSTQIDQTIINQAHDARINKEPLTVLFKEYAKMMGFTIVEPTTPNQLLNGQIFLFLDDSEYAYLAWRHHAGYTEAIGPDTIPAACQNLEYRLKKNRKSIL